jgi:hypothetical protein
MRKRSKDAEKEAWAALEELMDARDAVAMEVMREVFARLPYGQKFTLSDGSVAHLEKLAAPELCPNERSDYFQRPHFGVDVVIEGGKLDHIEITAFQSGSGMAVGPPDAKPDTRVRLAGADERKAASDSEHPGAWAASEKRGGGDRSAPPPSRPPEHRGGGGNASTR